MAPDWLDHVLRGLAVTAMGYGAYQSYRRTPRNGTWPGALCAIALLLLYGFGGVLIVIAYALVMAGDYLFLFVLAAGTYVVGGFYVWWKLANRIQARFAAKAARVAATVDVSRR